MELKTYGDEDSSALQQYINSKSLRLLPVQVKLIEETKKLPRYGMLSSTDEIQFLQNLLRTLQARKVIEVGVFTGYATMAFALALPENGKVVACDISEEYPNVGKPFWKEAGVDHKIDLRIAPAKDTLDSLIAAGECGTFDFAFIDADKLGYDTYYELCLKLLRPGGIIAVDNTLWDGRVVTGGEHSDIHTKAIMALNDKLKDDNRIDISFLLLGDGTTLCFKR